MTPNYIYTRQHYAFAEGRTFVTSGANIWKTRVNFVSSNISYLRKNILRSNISYVDISLQLYQSPWGGGRGSQYVILHTQNNSSHL